MKPYLIFVFSSYALFIFAQVHPGDIFKEYYWAVTNNDGNEPFLRVCGDGYYEDQTRKGEGLFKAGFVQDGWFTLQEDIDLDGAVKAEVIVEKMLCHDGTTGLSVKFNDYEWLKVPEAAMIPYPQEEYLHHYNGIISIPLKHLKKGKATNKFRFTIGDKQRWGMPQIMVYGMVVRVYYGKNKKPFEANITSIKHGDVLGEKVQLDIKSNQLFTNVDYLGYYEDINLEGDGVYTQWHHKYNSGKLAGIIGSSVNGKLVWNTEWLPDQPAPMKIAARVTDKDGLIYFTPAIENLTLSRPYKVELCKPYDIPRRWATRERIFQSAFDVKGNVLKAEKFRIVATTWSPGYLNGVYLNDFLLMDREGCKYCYHVIDKVIDHPEFLQNMNALKTGHTPLVRGKMTHGTEIQYPGFMVLVKYKSN
jgi:hypothetical protein